MLALSSSGLMTSAWTAVMRTRFKSYALGRDGLPIRIDGYFGYDEEGVQKQYQLRTGQSTTGQVSDADLHQLGLLPTLITTHGTGQPDPFGIGYPADMARRMLDLYWWQPTGNYPATAVPMNHSADAGEAEIVRFLNDPVIVPGPTVFIDYSQGSICGGRARNRIRKGEFRPGVQILGGVTFGNPMALPGVYAGTVDPGGQGIDPDLETASEPGMLHMRNRGDIYTATKKDGAGEFERMIFKMVFEQFTGDDSVLEQISEFFKEPLWETINAGVAITRGGLFLVRGTGPHVQYHTTICPGTTQTFYEYGITHLRDLATARLERIVANAKSGLVAA